MSGIYGVTNREALDTRLLNGGKLRKGAEKRPNAPGKDLEYFRFTSDNVELVKAFRKIYGEKPDSLEVFLPYPYYGDVFHTARELYGQNHLLKEQCDGMNIVQWQDGPRMVKGKRLCEKKCKNVETRPPCIDCNLVQIGRLSVILIPLFYAGFPVTITMETHSWNDLGHIASQLAKYEPLTGRAFRMYRQETRIGRPDKKSNKRAATDKWLVRIEPTQETAILLIEDAKSRARQALLVDPANVPQLTAPPPANKIGFDNGDQDEYDETVIDSETGEILQGQSQDTDSPPPDEPDDPDFSDWKPNKWGSFCTLAAERFGCFESADYVWPFIKNRHGNPPEASYDEVWTSCVECDSVPE